MSTENERSSRRTVAWTAGIATTATAAACLVGGWVLTRLGYISKPGEDGSSGTKSPTREPSPTPTPTVAPTETFIPTATSTRTLEPTLTSTLTLTPTSELPELGEGIISDHPAFINVLGTEKSGVSNVTVDKFKDYFLQREFKVASNNPEIQRLDRMFGQLSLPVKNLTDRGLNFDWRNSGQGLGFDLFDFEVLRTFEQMKLVQGSISQVDADGNHRAWTIAPARDFEKVVLAYVDEDLRIRGIASPATDPAVQGQRKALFDRIVYGDLGVQAGDTDGLWQTVNDKFYIPCETYTANARVRSKQSEAVRSVEFNPDLETDAATAEGDTIYQHDSDNTVLVVMVASPDGYLRVESYDLSDPTDPLNPALDSSEVSGVNPRAFGGRWIPCGPGAQKTVPTQTNVSPGEKSTHTPSMTPTMTPTAYETPTPVPSRTNTPTITATIVASETPTATRTPEPQPSPTPVPTNTHYPIPTATGTPTATEIPTATGTPEPQPTPTWVPTNTHYPIPTATIGPAPTLEPTATDIP